MLIIGLAIGRFAPANYFSNILRFYRDLGGSLRKLSLGALTGAAMDVFAHNGFKGGWHIKSTKAGCYRETKSRSYHFLAMHALLFYGFMAALASTILAGIYQDFLGVLPPYPVLSLPVLLGILGGVSMIKGTALFLVADGNLDSGKNPLNFEKMDIVNHIFLYTLALVSITGFLTLIFRNTALIGTMFTIHMGLVLLLFVTAPYDKFVHFTYRYTALVWSRIEETV